MVYSPPLRSILTADRLQDEWFGGGLRIEVRRILLMLIKLDVNSKFQRITAPKPHRQQSSLGSLGTWNFGFYSDPPAKTPVNWK
jgi:hypothetical protein